MQQHEKSVLQQENLELKLVLKRIKTMLSPNNPEFIPERLNGDMMTEECTKCKDTATKMEQIVQLLSQVECFDLVKNDSYPRVSTEQ